MPSAALAHAHGWPFEDGGGHHEPVISDHGVEVRGGESEPQPLCSYARTHARKHAMVARWPVNWAVLRYGEIVRERARPTGARVCDVALAFIANQGRQPPCREPGPGPVSGRFAAAILALTAALIQLVVVLLSEAT